MKDYRIKAMELINTMFFIDLNDSYVEHEMCYKNAVKCAIETVKEIKKAIDFDWMDVQNLDRQHVYWDKVQDELQEFLKLSPDKEWFNVARRNKKEKLFYATKKVKG